MAGSWGEGNDGKNYHKILSKLLSFQRVFVKNISLVGHKNILFDCLCRNLKKPDVFPGRRILEGQNLEGKWALWNRSDKNEFLQLKSRIRNFQFFKTINQWMTSASSNFLSALKYFQSVLVINNDHSQSLSH